MSILGSLWGSARRAAELEGLRAAVVAEVRQLAERVEELHRKVDRLAEQGGAAPLLERLEAAERQRRELGDQAEHLVELLGDARRGLAVAEESARRARESE